MRSSLEPLIDSLFEEDEFFAQDFEENGLNRVLFIRKLGIHVEASARLERWVSVLYLILLSLWLVQLKVIAVAIWFNPLRPNNDVSQTSHCNIKGVSVSEVMRIENMITQVQCYWYFNSLSPLLL